MDLTTNQSSTTSAYLPPINGNSTDWDIPEASTDPFVVSIPEDQTADVSCERESPFDDSSISIRSIMEACLVRFRTEIARPAEIGAKATDKLLFLLNTEDIEFGVNSQSETLVSHYLKLNPLLTRNWLNEVFVSNFGDVRITAGILHIVSRFSELEMYPQGQTMALAALSHQDNEIKELGVRVFEQWGTRKSLSILQDVHVETIWLQNYVNQVVGDLRAEYGLLGA